MREYETIYITHPNLSDSQQTQIDERLRSVIERRKGRVFFQRSMGKRPLAYPLKKQTAGVYVLMDYAAEGGAVNELERYIRLDENILRFLTVVKKEKVDVEARAAEVNARGEDQPTKEAGQEEEREETRASGEANKEE